MLRFVGYQVKSTIVIGIHWRVENESISPFRRASCYTCTYAHCECVGRRFAKCIGPCRLALELSCRRRHRRGRPLGRTRNEFATIAWNDCPVIYGYAYIASSVSHVCAYICAYPSQKRFNRAIRIPRMRATSKENQSARPGFLCFRLLCAGQIEFILVSSFIIN